MFLATDPKPSFYRRRRLKYLLSHTQQYMVAMESSVGGSETVNASL